MTLVYGSGGPGSTAYRVGRPHAYPSVEYGAMVEIRWGLIGIPGGLVGVPNTLTPTLSRRAREEWAQRGFKVVGGGGP